MKNRGYGGYETQKGEKPIKGVSMSEALVWTTWG